MFMKTKPLILESHDVIGGEKLSTQQEPSEECPENKGPAAGKQS
jgi:hypothetical protein